MGKLYLKQILTRNIDGNDEFISTGATLNNLDYISLPSILSMYETSDPTLRKYLKKNGLKNVDYFYSDGKLFISVAFLDNQSFRLKSENTATFHPYRKKRIRGCVVPYEVIDDTSKKCTTIRGKIEKELIKINWDYFITINTIKYINADEWDYIMDKFINSLANQVESKRVCAAYTKEKSIKEKKIKRKYDSEQRHIHILLHRDSKVINIDTIKSLFLRSMGKKSFGKKEFYLEMYDKNQNGIDYMLKEFSEDNSNFSMIFPE
jgi:hypothetical protein